MPLQGLLTQAKHSYYYQSRIPWLLSTREYEAAEDRVS
jgi:hypothetical protein